MKQQPTFKDLFEFVLKNKTNKTFLGFTDGQIAWKLNKGIEEGTLLYALNFNGKVCGMILAEKNVEKKVLFITENLAMSLSVLRQFAKIAKERFPDYTLEWLKHGIHKKHNTQQLYKKLT